MLKIASRTLAAVGLVCRPRGAMRRLPPLSPPVRRMLGLVPTSPVASGQFATNAARQPRIAVPEPTGKSVGDRVYRAPVRYTVKAHVAHWSFLRRRPNLGRVQHRPSLPPGPAAA